MRKIKCVDMLLEQRVIDDQNAIFGHEAGGSYVSNLIIPRKMWMRLGSPTDVRVRVERP